MSRWRISAVTAAGILLTVPSLQGTTAPRLVWNASASVPLGLYRIEPGPFRRGDLVLTRLPPDVAELAHRRGYLPKSAYLIKFVWAVAGDRVCRFGNRIFIRRRFVAFALPADDAGRAMPGWHGCRILKIGQVFVLAGDPASFDSRYFGPLDAKSLVGRGILLWSHRSTR